MDKYEFVEGDTKQVKGVTLKRIRAVVAIAAFGVAAGDLGGYIEAEKNLSFSGDAWVSGNAQVYGDAWVSGNAQVYGNAQVSGNGAIVWFTKVGRDNGTLTVYHGKEKELIATRGCFIGTIDEFLEKSEREHDDKTHLEYRLLIEVAYSRLTR